MVLSNIEIGKPHFKFYGSVNTIKVISSWSVNLLTLVLFLSRFSPVVNQCINQREGENDRKLCGRDSNLQSATRRVTYYELVYYGTRLHLLTYRNNRRNNRYCRIYLRTKNILIRLRMHRSILTLSVRIWYPLRKHAYSNILKNLPQKMNIFGL